MCFKIVYSRIAIKMACTILAAVFIISGLAKFLDISGTVDYFLEFSFVGPFLALWLTSFLVSLELTLGIALILKQNPTEPLLICSGVMLFFTVYQIVMLLFPSTFIKTCPCFGGSVPISGADFLPLARNVLLLLLAVFCYFYYKRRPAGSPNCDLPNK